MFPWRAWRARAGWRHAKSLTPPATIAVENINKELTPEGSFEPAAPVITIRLVNGRLMAKRAFSRI
jgi:hypothetical protein